MNTGNQMLARFDGICACGGTIAPGDLIAYDAVAKQVSGCRACGLSMNKGMIWSLKGTATPPFNATARERANTLVAARASLVAMEAWLAKATTDEQVERRTRIVAGRREDLALAERDAAGLKGERKWQRCTPRDIELAEKNRLAAKAKADKLEAEEKAADEEFVAACKAERAGE